MPAKADRVRRLAVDQEVDIVVSVNRTRRAFSTGRLVAVAQQASCVRRRRGTAWRGSLIKATPHSQTNPSNCWIPKSRTPAPPPTAACRRTAQAIALGGTYDIAGLAGETRRMNEAKNEIVARRRLRNCDGLDILAGRSGCRRRHTRSPKAAAERVDVVSAGDRRPAFSEASPSSRRSAANHDFVYGFAPAQAEPLALARARLRSSNSRRGCGSSTSATAGNREGRAWRGRSDYEVDEPLRALNGSKAARASTGEPDRARRSHAGPGLPAAAGAGARPRRRPVGAGGVAARLGRRRYGSRPPTG